MAFNLDFLFRRAGAHGKQALTMAMDAQREVGPVGALLPFGTAFVVCFLTAMIARWIW